MLDKVPAEKPNAKTAEIGEAQVLVQEAELDSLPVLKKTRGARLGRILLFIFKNILQLLLMVGVIGGSVYVMRSLIASKPEPKKRPVFQSVFTVEDAKASISDHQPVFSVFGTVTAGRNVALRALSAGEIKTVHDDLKVGARIGKDETLVIIDTFEYKGALAEAKANLAEVEARLIEKQARIEGAEAQIEATKSQLKIAQEDLTRAEGLLTRGTLTRKDVDSRRISVNERELSMSQRTNNLTVEKAGIAQLDAQKKRLEWRVEKAQRDLDNTELKSPFAGIVQVANAEVGRNISGSDVLVELYDDAELDVKFTLSDAQFGRLAASNNGLIGRPVDAVWSVGGKEYIFKGKVARIGAQISAERGGVELFATLDPQSGGIALRPGAFVELRVPDMIFPDSVKLPETVLYDGDHVYAMVKGKLVRKDVEVLAFTGNSVIVRGDFKADERILNTRLAQISEGTRVRTKDDPKPQRRGRPTANSNSKGATKQNPQSGTSDRAEIAKQVRQASKISQADWEAMPREKRRELIQAFRAKQNN